MSRFIIGLYDESGYMELLADYLERLNSKLEIHLFTRKESLEAYLENNKMDILLLGEEVEAASIYNVENAQKRLILSEEPLEEGESKGLKFFKYQSASCLIEEIFGEVLMTDSGWKERRKTKEKVSIFGVFRLWENSPKTILQLLERGEIEGKTLILDMGCYSGFLPVEKRNQGMSELLFYLKQQTAKIVRKLPGLIQEWQGIDYLCPVKDYRDLYGITGEEMDLLFQILEENTEYETVILDFGFLGDATLYLLKKCDYIYIGEPRNEWERNQQNDFLRFLQSEKMEKVISRITYLSV